MKGSYVALITPFKDNEIDYNALERLLNFHLENHTDGILLCGTTGESPTLAGDEKESLIRFAIKIVKNKIPIMIGCGTNNLSHTIAACQRAKNLGADFAMVITPYYNKPTQNGLYHYFKKVVENTDIPIVIYNVPNRTGVNIIAKTTLRLAREFKQIVAIKEASGNLVQVSEIIRDTPEGFSLMSGEDALNFPIMCCGAKGSISVTANILPKKVHDLIEYTKKKNYEIARQIHLELLEINQTLFIETNPIPVKKSLALIGMITDELRLPLYKLEEKNEIILMNVLKNYKLI
ncbi:MAG: 4-hydroxy-tetrahydrodipicolinate synthase [Candidatus Cloacimonetes bacterium]|nr:4-hydroxy-tetrahydrodipicolinate synthase [Candidatus Cloacimonadota bacterium]